MQLANFTDSPPAGLREPQKCASCNSASRLESGLCLNCLLSSALEGAPVSSAKATFKDALAAMEIRHTKSRIGDYEIVNEIGRGGMGVIYRAREPHSERIVALKCILSYHADSDQTLARFRREAEMAARLDHPNIMPIYSVGEDDDGVPFFSMKFASGGNLAQARSSLRHKPRQSVLLAAKVALAVQYAHEQGVLHRDLKPGNILLDHRGEPLVSDFGLAKWQETSTDLTQSLTIFGTPGYIAPEQAEGPAKRLTAAADIYSLGAILFDLLTGRPPFMGEHALAVVREVREKSAPRLRSLVPDLDRDLETICGRCLEREPSARYQSAAELAGDLNNWLDGRLITARRLGMGYRLCWWLRRNRMLAAALATASLLAAACVIWQVHARKLQFQMRENILASRSVTVRPLLDLDNLTPDPATAQSIASSLERELNLLGPARVITVQARSNRDWFRTDMIRKFGQEAKTRTVLTGTVRTIQGKRSISFRLRDSATAENLLTHRYEEIEQKDQTNPVDKKTAQQIYAILSSNDWSNIIGSKMDPGLRNPTAKEAIMAGRDLMFRYTASDFDHAIDLFKKALKAVPDSSLAHSYLAIAATSRSYYIADPSFLELGKAEAAEALRLSPTSADAHRALAGVYYREGKFGQALDEAMQTIENGGLELRVARLIGMALDTLGRPDRALDWFTLASMKGGTPGDLDAFIGDCWVKLCDNQRASEAYNRALELQPDSPQGGVGLCHLRLLNADFDTARELCRTGHWTRGNLGETERIAAQIEFFARRFDVADKLYNDLAKNDPDGGGSFYGMTYRSALGRVRQALGDSRGAQALLEECLEKEREALRKEPANPEALHRLAAVEASLGMLERSIGHLRAAAQSGSIDYRSLTLDPRFDAVRKTPEFQKIVNDLSVKVAEMRVKSQNNYR